MQNRHPHNKSDFNPFNRYTEALRATAADLRLSASDIEADGRAIWQRATNPFMTKVGELRIRASYLEEEARAFESATSEDRQTRQNPVYTLIQYLSMPIKGAVNMIRNYPRSFSLDGC